MLNSIQQTSRICCSVFRISKWSRSVAQQGGASGGMRSECRCRLWRRINTLHADI